MSVATVNSAPECSESAVVVLGGSQMICFLSGKTRWRKGKIKETDGILVAAETKWHETLHGDGWQLAHFSNWMDADDLKCLMPSFNVPPCRHCFLTVKKEYMAGGLGHDKKQACPGSAPGSYPAADMSWVVSIRHRGLMLTTSAGFSWRGWAEVPLWASPGCLSVCEVSHSSRLQ